MAAPTLITTPARENGITSDYRKYIIHAGTPNDIKLSFSSQQKTRIPKFLTGYLSNDRYGWYKPFTNNLQEDTDIAFGRLYSPDFPIIIEKIKICLHSEATFGCLKLNVWDLSNQNNPVNLVGLNDETTEINSPFTIFEEQTLISNALEEEENTPQVTSIAPYGYTLSANSLLRFGLQYAESDAYGLKVFIIGWAAECNS